ncbi:hypothetical protein EIL87_13500 [Saccharopolyspora rhizosphaerae]|uniref:Uncharacterized protein n=1 Tax=Saccharopolyspora rhizosphaerae TaxID=2492662 RepID=A0A3R8Q0V8_9PSEU|nr:hypothetical protein [Saccharopolyspora rhizosphaerae]RRO16082.1 hypothetical protein EIL87_13500 [Saccharopolyspora rhizosphaerae]
MERGRARRLRRGRWVSVKVPGWGGPISNAALAGELITPLTDTGLSWNDVRAAVFHLSGGTVTPTP